MAHRPVARRRTQGSLRAAHAATASALALVLVLALALAGCTGSSEPPPPTPESTAAALAAGLSSGDLPRMPVSYTHLDVYKRQVSEFSGRGMGASPHFPVVLSPRTGSCCAQLR